MIELISTGVGTLLGLGKKYLEGKAKKEEFNRDVELEKVRSDLESSRLNLLHNQNMQVEGIKTLAETLKSAYKHDTAIKVDGSKGNKWLNMIRGLVRPLITYGASLLLGFVTIYMLVAFIQYRQTIEGADTQSLQIMYDTIINPWFKTTFSTIIGFWFGQR